MNLAFGVLFLWSGASLLYIATHGLGASTPWGAYTALLAKMRESDSTPPTDTTGGGNG